jgi:hypothetical protein
MNCQFKIVYTDEAGDTRVFGYVEHPHGGVWLRIAKLLKWVKNPRVVAV